MPVLQATTGMKQLRPLKEKNQENVARWKREVGTRSKLFSSSPNEGIKRGLWLVGCALRYTFWQECNPCCLVQNRYQESVGNNNDLPNAIGKTAKTSLQGINLQISSFFQRLND